MHFCKITSLHLYWELYLYGNQYPVVQETKFLSQIFDSKLNFKVYIKYLRDRGRYKSSQSSESDGAYGLRSGLCTSFEALSVACPFET
jgi:hypothetical protein